MCTAITDAYSGNEHLTLAYHTALFFQLLQESHKQRVHALQTKIHALRKEELQRKAAAPAQEQARVRSQNYVAKNGKQTRRAPSSSMQGTQSVSRTAPKRASPNGTVSQRSSATRTSRQSNPKSRVDRRNGPAHSVRTTAVLGPNTTRPVHDDVS